MREEGGEAKKEKTRLCRAHHSQKLDYFAEEERSSELKKTSFSASTKQQELFAMAYVVSFVFCLLELSARAFEAENRRGHGEGMEEKNSLSFDRQKKNGVTGSALLVRRYW